MANPILQAIQNLFGGEQTPPGFHRGPNGMMLPNVQTQREAMLIDLPSVQSRPAVERMGLGGPAPVDSRHIDLMTALQSWAQNQRSERRALRSGPQSQFRIGDQWFYRPRWRTDNLADIPGLDQQNRDVPNGAIMIRRSNNREI